MANYDRVPPSKIEVILSPQGALESIIYHTSFGPEPVSKQVYGREVKLPRKMKIRYGINGQTTSHLKVGVPELLIRIFGRDHKFKKVQDAEEGPDNRFRRMYLREPLSKRVREL